MTNLFLIILKESPLACNVFETNSAFWYNWLKWNIFTEQLLCSRHCSRSNNLALVVQLLSHVQLFATPWAVATRLLCPLPSPEVCMPGLPVHHQLPESQTHVQWNTWLKFLNKKVSLNVKNIVSYINNSLCIHQGLVRTEKLSHWCERGTKSC